MICARSQVPDRPEITAQLVRDDDTGFTEPVDQPCQKTSCSLGVVLWLNENVKDVAVRVDRPPEPVFSAVDWDDDLIQVPFVACGRSVAPDAIGKVAAKAVHPFSDRFPADHHTPIGEKFLDIRRAEREAMVDPDDIRNDFTRETVAFQARHGGWYIHTQRLNKRSTANKLAIPVEVLERVQLSGRAFLGRIAEYADRIDTLRSEIDLGYARLGRLKGELNRLTGVDLATPVPEIPKAVTGPQATRYRNMHGRFFRLLRGLGRLKERRRALYRRIDGVKKSWFGHVGNIRAALAAKHGAVVVREDLSVLAVEKKDVAYKGRTFNKMINNSAKGQYTRRADNTLEWRGIATLKLPSFYSSSTDWRTGTVDKGQRSGSRFRAQDGAEWDADLHAAELLARWLFLRPKPAVEAAAPTL